MKEYFKNKYRVASIRLQHWNYAWPAMYYITICSKILNGDLSKIE